MATDEYTSLMDAAEEATRNATQTTIIGSSRAWQASPSRPRNNDCKPNYHSESYKRTDLRTVDGHYSWQQVYHLCDAGGGRP